MNVFEEVAYLEQHIPEESVLHLKPDVPPGLGIVKEITDQQSTYLTLAGMGFSARAISAKEDVPFSEARDVIFSAVNTLRANSVLQAVVGAEQLDIVRLRVHPQIVDYDPAKIERTLLQAIAFGLSEDQTNAALEPIQRASRTQEMQNRLTAKLQAPNRLSLAAWSLRAGITIPFRERPVVQYPKFAELRLPTRKETQSMLVNVSPASALRNNPVWARQSLNPLEQKILELKMSGFTQAEMAEHCGIKKGNVSNVLTRISGKLGSSNERMLAVTAEQIGLAGPSGKPLKMSEKHMNRYGKLLQLLAFGLTDEEIAVIFKKPAKRIKAEVTHASKSLDISRKQLGVEALRCPQIYSFREVQKMESTATS